jgi:hypothetical protein
MAKWGNWVADGIAGRARKMAEKEKKEWVASVDTWNAEVDRRDRMGGVAKAVAKPVCARTVPLLPACGNWRTTCSGCCVGRTWR